MSVYDRMRRLERRLGGHRLAEDAPMAALLSDDEQAMALEGLIAEMVRTGASEDSARAEVAAICARVRGGGGDANYN